MKEENKKKTTSAKKTSTSKTATSKKSSTTKKAVSAKKTTTQKVASTKTAATKKVASTKASATPKVSASKKKPVKKVTEVKKVSTPVVPVVKEEVVADVKVEKKEIANDNVKVVNEPKGEKTINKNLVMNAILLVSYVLIIVIIIIGFVEYLIYSNNSNNTTVTTPYIVSEKVLNNSNIIELEDAKFKLSSLVGDYFIYLNYTSGSANNFEKELQKMINKYDLKNSFYYINIDKVKDEDNKEELVNKYLGYKNNIVTKLPTVIYVDRNGEVRKENIIIKKDNETMTIGDFQKILDINQFKEKK